MCLIQDSLWQVRLIFDRFLPRIRQCPGRKTCQEKAKVTA